MKLITALSIFLANNKRGSIAFSRRSILASVNRAGRQIAIPASLSNGHQAVCRSSDGASVYLRQGFECGSHWVPSLSYSVRGGSSTVALNSAVQAETQEKKAAPVEIFRKDYTAPANWVKAIEMDINIEDGKTTVTSWLTVEANSASPLTDTDLSLDGDENSVTLLRLSVDGKDLMEGIDYKVEPGKLSVKRSAVLKAGKEVGVLETVVSIVPETNTQLSGLYKSGSMYCSQCEAEGFRRITYYPDRPDNMATFGRVRIEANKDDYPVLLSNGNLLETGELEGSRRHYSVWSDPFPKPSYLFCAVAGNLGSIKDSFTTASGREVKLQIFSERENVSKLYFAMESLKKSMKWDEEKYGLEYDLDLYNIVAVNDFNMGAMENKGLNVFNTAYVLADPVSATDGDYERVEGVIGHEYFHNWTGNRVTCRDWFQLTLKEGLTVFRDQEFSGDLRSKAVKRIETVRGLRGRQFAEDAGPMSHPIRPDSYIAMDNFYTATVYTKGAEVIKMYDTLLGSEGFRKGMDLYFERHDGAAVTCDDFREAMADANGLNLDQFERWYFTPGTPTITYSYSYDTGSGTLKLTLSQSSASSDPLHIPVSTGLIDKSTGDEIVPTTVLELREKTQTFEFSGLKGDVIPSILRDFSSPVKLLPASGVEDEKILSFLAAYDTDGFNKWEAGQKLYTSLIFKQMHNEDLSGTSILVDEAFGRTLADETITDHSIKAYALTMPSEAALAEELDVVDPVALRRARKVVKKQLARTFEEQIRALYDKLTKEMNDAPAEFTVDAASVGRRRLRNVMLEYLCCIGDTPEEQENSAAIASEHYERATGLTDKLAALGALASMDGAAASARDKAMSDFYNYARGDALVLDKWFQVQALADLPDVIDRVKALSKQRDFTLKNPNRCRSLIGAFSTNLAAFHDASGDGYRFLGEMISELDKLNPQVSSRMANSLIQWRRYDKRRAAMLKAELERLASMTPISDDLFEIVSRGLK